MLSPYFKTAGMAATAKTHGGIVYLLPDILIKVFSLITQLYLWQIVIQNGATVDMTNEQMQSYVFVSALLSELLMVSTPATGWLSEGVLLKFYSRPLPILNQLIAITVGGWIPMLLLFSLPMAVIGLLLGIPLVAKSAYFLPSLLLCISLGFAIDVLFACLSIKLKNMSWLIDRIRSAIVGLLSGSLIPIALLPFGLAQLLRYQPFASLAGAPLSIFVGVGNAHETFIIQLCWNLVAWPLALAVFHMLQQEVVSYGG